MLSTLSEMSRSVSVQWQCDKIRIGINTELKEGERDKDGALYETEESVPLKAGFLFLL